jgi:phosphoribosyl-dephospho-CoA transferase
MGTHTMTTASFFPHDLLWLSGAEAMFADDPRPDWAREALQRLPVVVVRRAASRYGDCVAIGVRGSDRAQRFAGFAPSTAVRKLVAPEDMVTDSYGDTLRARTDIPAIRALRKVIARWNDHNPLEQPFVWGPIGSVGFELATGMTATRPESDLDLVLRAPFPLSKIQARLLLDALEGLPVRVDVQMETPLGCVVLKEYVYSKAPWLLLRTNHGPRPVSNPWSLEKE